MSEDSDEESVNVPRIRYRVPRSSDFEEINLIQLSVDRNSWQWYCVEKK